MPYKCSVKFCRSNYDSTNEKVSVFQFPVDQGLRDLWLQNVVLNSKITSSSRICIKHFDPNDIDHSNTRRSMLKPKVIPLPCGALEPESFSQKAEIKSESQQSEAIDFIEDPLPIEEEATEDAITSFADFVDRLEDMQGSITESWNIYTHHDGVCFYRLASRDEEFNDVNMSFKILINKDLRVKVYSYDNEASSDELEWLLKDSQLTKWSQFDSLIDTYQHEPDVTLKKSPIKSLKKAYEVLDQFQWDELQDKVDELKYEIASLYQSPELELEFYPEDIPRNTFEMQATDDPTMDSIEYLEDDEDFIDRDLDDSSVKVECSEESQQDSADEAMETETVEQTKIEEDEIEYENPYKCENCLITLMSETGFRAHQKTCNQPMSVKMSTRSLKNSESLLAPKSDLNICNCCGKSFRTVKGLKDHMKLHDLSLRQKCPLCDIVLYTGTLKRHIDAVHKRLKPHSCSSCGKAFSTSTLRNDHESTHVKNLDMQKHLINIDGSPRYSCPKCSAHYETSTLLKRHMEKNCRLAEKKRTYRYPCFECSKNFITKIQAAHHKLSVHKIAIENLEKFCFECNEEFEDYVNHVRVHSCQFACTFCGSKFLTQEKVQKHEESKHAGETIDDRPFKCLDPNCGLSFKNVNHLKSHQQAIHSHQEREFICEHCNKRFALRSLLTAHARSHLKDYAMFPCNFNECARRFKKLNNLKEHCLRDHGSWEIYLCNYEEKCEERFKMLNELKIHRQNEHGVNFNIHKYFENK